MFSYFSTYNAENQTHEIESKLNNILVLLVILLIPISYITFVFSTELVKIVYYRGDFTLEAVQYTAAALKGYALAFPFVAIRDILTKSMYSFQDTARPMRNVTVSVLLGIAFSVILSRMFGIFGITLGTGLSVFVEPSWPSIQCITHPSVQIEKINYKWGRPIFNSCCHCTNQYFNIPKIPNQMCCYEVWRTALVFILYFWFGT